MVGEGQPGYHAFLQPGGRQEGDAVFLEGMVGISGQVMAGDDDLSAHGPDHAGDGAQEQSLTAAFHSSHANDLPAAQIQGDIPDFEAVVLDGQVVQAQVRVTRGARVARPYRDGFAKHHLNQLFGGVGCLGFADQASLAEDGHART